MRGFHNSSFDPQTLVLIEKVFDEAWLTLKSVGNKTVKPDELARCVPPQSAGMCKFLAKSERIGQA